MRWARPSWRLGLFVLAAALLVLSALLGATRTVQAGQDPDADLPMKFTAFAANLSNVNVGARAQTIDIEVTRWSTEGEQKRLLTILKEKGEKALLDEMQSLPKVGSFRTPHSLAYDLRFASVRRGEDGGMVIFLATDRYINFWEVRDQSRTLDYPFTLIDLRVGPNGEGEGRMSVAARIGIEAGVLVLENFADQPVMLKQVRRR